MVQRVKTAYKVVKSTHTFLLLIASPLHGLCSWFELRPELHPLADHWQNFSSQHQNIYNRQLSTRIEPKHKRSVITSCCNKATAVAELSIHPFIS